MIGAGELLWGLFIKFTPLKLYQCISLDESPLEEGATSISNMLKKSSVMRTKSQQAKAMQDKLGESMKNRIAE